MISKNDCYLLLAGIKESGIDTSLAIEDLTNSSSPSIAVIKFINDNRQLDLSRFYEKLRKSYNQKKSKLYINIVKEIDVPSEVLSTLSALLTQIMLYAKTVDDQSMFLKHSRAREILQVLNIYLSTSDLTKCLELMRIIKADIKALEAIR